ncbi:NUDIX hydrolase domain-like protein [Mycotypha africana]|uniref:NUDIX hydrolase domain-like protein n=1 Tax=Mycotypha africana TaxID=64632 RepID=UPI002301AD95|nr:NUDIX hydrolase domain-like protein [Mycotypha africana]KAI8977242.1 NUDIX hydrolase domain-like protein [Mycotypha africana]
MEKKDEVIYSMTPRHGHAQDVFDENGIRQVAGCLPIDPINKRFLLVSSSSDPTVWVIPKGGWEKDETQKQAAMRETWEEAGVKGIITRHIGVFAEKTRGGVKAHHWIYEMEIKEVCKKFPEQKKRERRWVRKNHSILFHFRYLPRSICLC